MAAIAALHAKGVKVVVQQLGGSTTQHMEALGVIVGMTDDAAALVRAAEKRAAEAETVAWQEAETIWRETVGRMLRDGTLTVRLADHVRPIPKPDKSGAKDGVADETQA